MSPAVALMAGVIAVAVVVLLLRGSGGAARPESRLLRICQGNEAQAERLLAAELARAPGISRSEAASRAVQRYQRDNR
jgi:hypothetical protein